MNKEEMIQDIACERWSVAQIKQMNIIITP